MHAKIIAAFGLSLLLAGCFEEDSATKRERQATANLTAQASTQVGMPAVTRFTEKRLMKMLYELRDNPNLVTYSYYVDLNGKRHRACPGTSIGYGIPYATQYSNPQRDTFYGDGASSGSSTHFQMPQAEPNGLFMPASAEGTWVMCMAPDGKTIAPAYIEQRVMIYQFEMTAAD